MNIWRNSIMTIIVIILFGWGIIALYEAQVQFAEIVKNPEPSWDNDFSNPDPCSNCHRRDTNVRFL